MHTSQEAGSSERGLPSTLGRVWLRPVHAVGGVHGPGLKTGRESVRTPPKRQSLAASQRPPDVEATSRRASAATSASAYSPAQQPRID